MKKLFYLLLALPLVFAACEEPEQGTDKPVEKTKSDRSHVVL